MEIVSARPTAKILMFPLAGRKSALNLGAKAKFAAEVRAIRKLDVLAESGWYHQEAIDSAANARKN